MGNSVNETFTFCEWKAHQEAYFIVAAFLRIWEKMAKRRHEIIFHAANKVVDD